MKKYIFAFFAFCLLSAPALRAAEEMALAPTSISSEGRTGNPFSMTVSGSGKMIPNPGPVFTEGGNYEGVEMPYLVSTPQPIQYPRWAMRQGWEGSFHIAIEILPDGSVGRYKVMKSTGHELLDKAATQAVLTWKFHPAIKNGKPALTCIRIPVHFKLQAE